MQTQSNLKLTNRITNKGGNWGKLRLTFKHLDNTRNSGWRWNFYHKFDVKDTNQTRNYIKSSDFQDFLYKEIFKKYEGMTYDELCELHKIENINDKNKIKDKLKDYLYDFNSNNEIYDYHIQITKHSFLKYSSGLFTGYILVQGRIYNSDYTRYRTFKFIVDYCEEDVMQYYMPEEDELEENGYKDIDDFYKKFNLTDKKIIDYIDDFCLYPLDYIKSFDDCEKFYKICKKTIKGYNERYRRCA